MNLSARMQKKCGLLIRLYRETKVEAFGIFFAAVRGTDRTWAMMKKLYTRLIEIAARRGGESLTAQDVLSLALKMAKKAGKGDKIAYGDRIAVEEANLTERFFEEGEADERVAAILDILCPESSLLPPEALEKGRALLSRLPENAGDVLLRVVKNQSDEREILGDIEFRAERRYGKAHIARIALLCAVFLLCGWILYRQVQTGVFMIAAARYETDRKVVTLSAHDANPLPDAVEWSEEAPNIAQSVLDAVGEHGDDAEYRVDFLYYDRAEAESVKIDGETIFDLYREAYAEAAEYGRIHKLITNAVGKYYESYEIPFLPTSRESDFHSPYGDLYSCAFWYANEYASVSSGFKELWKKRSDIFADRESFWEYISSELFKRECSPILRLLSCEYRIEEAAGEEDEATREAYEELLFAYFNAENGAVNFSPLAVALPQESGSLYTTRLGEFGKLIAEAEEEAAMRHFEDRELTPAEYEYDYAGAFSAVFTGDEIRRLSEDENVLVLSLAFPEVPEVYPGTMDAHLASLITYGGEKTYAVWRVDHQAWVFYTNYLIPRKLPYGLVCDLRETFNSANTAYETILGYDYDVLYGHAERFTRRELFSKLSEGGKCAYVSSEGRSYTTIVPMP